VFTIEPESDSVSSGRKTLGASSSSVMSKRCGEADDVGAGVAA
jgi:hypothetical protein